MPVRTKIEISPALVRRVSGLDDLARIFLPDNRNHQRAFVAIWVEIKYSDRQFLLSTLDVAAINHLTPRTIELVRAKMKKSGLIKRISHFNPRFGYQSGWIFSDRFRRTVQRMSALVLEFSSPTGRNTDERKDRDALLYI